MITVYTDGSSRGNPGPGGYGAVMIYGQHRRELSEGYRRTTNNRMELLAVIKALEAIRRPDYPVTVYTDSKYVADAVEKGWLRNWLAKGFKGKKNEDLWRRFDQVARNRTIKFRWVRGHAGNVENERCDELAVAAALGSNLQVDDGFERIAK
ncbi:MAG: ribonuclease HI [Catalinimonas sp.]